MSRRCKVLMGEALTFSPRQTKPFAGSVLKQLQGPRLRFKENPRLNRQHLAEKLECQGAPGWSGSGG